MSLSNSCFELIEAYSGWNRNGPFLIQLTLTKFLLRTWKSHSCGKYLLSTYYEVGSGVTVVPICQSFCRLERSTDVKA